jgi:CBS domain-containing protein
VLGVVFVLIALVPGPPQAVDGVVAWLGYINLSLLVFNLIPALPLDGGRVLRAALWRFRRDFEWATRVAAGIGRGFGYIFIAAGIALFVFQGSFSGAWLAFIGWFLLEAATAESQYVLARRALAGLRVRDLMTPAPATVTPDLTLGTFMDDVVWRRRHTAYPVVDGGRALGLVPFRCLAQVPRGEWDERRVRECMLELGDVPLFRADEDAADALARLAESGGTRGLVVTDDGRLVGILSLSDFARALEAKPRRGEGLPVQPARELVRSRS